MIPWETLDSAPIPGQNNTLTLRRRGMEFSIRTSETELMNSRVHGSEDQLAELAVGYHHGAVRDMLIGGLGMGYTLAAALRCAPTQCRICVAELIPAVVRWNREVLGHLAGQPLTHPSVSVKTADVADIIGQGPDLWDIILLDVDNGPEGLTSQDNDRLYSVPGLKKAHAALRRGGILSVWSSGDNPEFSKRLEKNRFQTEIVRVRARKSGKGGRHTIWLARKK